MFCPNCGEMIQDNAAFCPNCGAIINKGANDVPAAAEAVVEEIAPAAVEAVVEEVAPAAVEAVEEAVAPAVNDLPEVVIPDEDEWKPTAPHLETEIPEIKPVEEPSAPWLKSAGITHEEKPVSLQKPAAEPAPAPAPVQPAPYTPAPASSAMVDSLSSSALTFGILSVCFCWVPILSIMALVFGAVAKKKGNTVRAMNGSITGKAKAGHILGCVGLGCSIGMTVFWTVYIILLVGVACAYSSYRYW